MGWWYVDLCVSSVQIPHLKSLWYFNSKKLGWKLQKGGGESLAHLKILEVNSSRSLYGN